ncbi:hypothetical protein SESBI_10783 [Sesbania bispinosa]|nr:hypothetical protein SESBI_10783 [Sesbania bispinosa]
MASQFSSQLRPDKDFYNMGASILFYSLWTIWKTRCKAVLKGKDPELQSVILACRDLPFEYQKAIESSLPTSYQTDRERVENDTSWRPPPPGIVKFNVDPTFRSSGIGAIGWVSRDELRNCLFSSAKQICASSAIVAEALALKEALSMGEISFGKSKTFCKILEFGVKTWDRPPSSGSGGLATLLPTPLRLSLSIDPSWGKCLFFPLPLRLSLTHRGRDQLNKEKCKARDSVF